MDEDRINTSGRRHLVSPADGWDKVGDSVDEDLRKLNEQIAQAMQEESRLNNDEFYGRPVPRGTDLRGRKVRPAPEVHGGLKTDETPDSYVERFDGANSIRANADSIKPAGPVQNTVENFENNVEKTGEADVKVADPAALRGRRPRSADLVKDEKTGRIKIVLSDTKKSVPPAQGRARPEKKTEPAVPAEPEEKKPQKPVKDGVFRITSSTTAREVSEMFRAQKRKLLFIAGGELLIGLVILIYGIITRAHPAATEGGRYVYPAVAFVLSLAAYALCGRETIVPGIESLTERKPGSATAVAVCWLLAMIQSLLAVFFADKVAEGVWIYAPAAALVASLFVLSRWLLCVKTETAAVTAAKAGMVYDLSETTNTEFIRKIGRDLTQGNEKVLYFSRAHTPGDFVNRSYSDDPASRFLPAVTLFSCIPALIVFVIRLIGRSGFFAAYSAFTGVILAAAPVSAVVTFAFVMYAESRNGRKIKNGIATYADAAELTETKSIIVDAGDFYNKNNCSLSGFRSFSSEKPETAIAYAAALSIKAGGPLAEAFRDVIEGRIDSLPEIKEFKYEERLGYSGLIDGKFVTFGTRAMMENHNSAVLAPESEEIINSKGSCISYLSINETLTAAFSVRYNKLPVVAKLLGELTADGLTILCHSTDPFVTAELLRSRLDLPAGSVMDLPPQASALYKSKISRPSASPAGKIFYCKDAAFMFRALVSAYRLAGMRSRVKMVSALASLVCALLCSVLLCLMNVPAPALFLVQAAETAATLLVTHISSPGGGKR